MKNYILTILLLTSTSLFSATKKLGLGAIIGSPTGIAGNYKLGDDRSIDAALAFDLGGKGNFQIHSTYLFHKPKSIDVEGEALGWYYGAGGRIRVVNNDNKNDKDDNDEFRLGARAASGLLWDFPEVPCDLFAQGALTVDIIPKTSADLSLSLGARYYF